MFHNVTCLSKYSMIFLYFCSSSSLFSSPFTFFHHVHLLRLRSSNFHHQSHFQIKATEESTCSNLCPAFAIGGPPPPPPPPPRNARCESTKHTHASICHHIFHNDVSTISSLSICQTDFPYVSQFPSISKCLIIWHVFHDVS